MKELVIVESPAKAKTIEKFLGPQYKVFASYGHIRDLPKGEFGIDIENNFHPNYVIPTKNRKRVNILKKEAEKFDSIILATDPDREGEAIAWHIVQILNNQNKDKSYKRIVFYEITKEALKKALENSRDINLNLVDAQQARRILDRIVGYKLSPLLWKKIKSGLSAGRVQSVALRLIVEREREIENFKPKEYWNIEALLQKDNFSEPSEFWAKLIKKDNKLIPKLGIKNKEEADKILSDLKGAQYKVLSIIKKEIERAPKPPFITSTLQQESFNKLKFSTKKTMFIAQQLYEGVEIDGKRIGLITYMRTDSFHLAQEAIKAIRKKIKDEFGPSFLSETPRQYKNKSKNTQEAHEAIRPTNINLSPEAIKNYLTKEQYKIYRLIWQRTIASQMKEAIFDKIIVDIGAKNYTFRAQGMSLKFLGFLKVYSEIPEDKYLPVLNKNEELKLKKITAQQKFTEPPSRYTEASLVKKLEENGIGRPSTYAPIISTIQERGYIKKEGRFLKPQTIGFIVNDLLIENFPEIVDISFTAKMEEKLDKIARGEEKWIPIIKDFYYPFIKNLEDKFDKIDKIKIPAKKSKEICEKCGRPMVIKEGKFGEFLACSGFPECKNTKAIIKKMNILCPLCGNEIIERRTKKGKIFYGCSAYPSCRFATWDKLIEKRCPKCQGIMTKKGKLIKCLQCDYQEKENKVV